MHMIRLEAHAACMPPDLSLFLSGRTALSRVKLIATFIVHFRVVHLGNVP